MTMAKNSAGAFVVSVVLMMGSMLAASCGNNASDAQQPGTVPSTTPSPSSSPVRTGMYGGKNIEVDVSDSGADLRFACARGHIAHRLTIDSQGGFDTDGTYQYTSAVGPGGDRPQYQAHYFGSVVNGKMTLSGTFIDERGRENSGPERMTATYGEQAVMNALCAAGPSS